MHKVKDAVTHDKLSHSSNTAPNDPNFANKADHRVDNAPVPDNRDSFTATAGTTSVGGASGMPNTTYGRPTEYDNPSSTNAGPHTSNIANQADPRVGISTGPYSTQGVTSGGYSNPNNYETPGRISSDYNNPRSTNAGPHGSNIANMADPRVDSDRSKFGNTGGMTSGGYNVENPRLANAEPNVTNRTDPNTNSGLDNRDLTSSVAPAGSSYTTPGSGTAQNTAGPHNSDLLNKLDPRVDSNLDNSRTIGRDATRS